MTLPIIIILCTLLILAYVFDLSAVRTKIPSVILLLVAGYVIRQLVSNRDIIMPDFFPLLPVLGTIGLIMIVLEGSLELELNRSKFSLIKKSVLGALLSMLAKAVLLAGALHLATGSSFQFALINIIPFCVISSSIAIPSSQQLSAPNKEFVVYESSLSDIFGVLFFNFFSLNETYNLVSVGVFVFQLAVIIVVSVLSTLLLAFLLTRIVHHVKFVPIILLIILIYAIAKTYHLPALVFILIFGICLGNLDELKHIKWISKLHPEELHIQTQRLKEVLYEVTFVIRALFFLLFGFLIDLDNLLNRDSFLWALGLVFLIYTVRMVQLKISSLPMKPLLFIAPRGLITILLFLSIPVAQRISIVNISLTTQVIIFTVLIMMAGSLIQKEMVDAKIKVEA